MLRLDGDILGGDCRGDLLLGERRLWLGDLTDIMSRRPGSRRAPSSSVTWWGRSVTGGGGNYLFDCSKSARRRFCSSVIDVSH